MNEDFQNRFEAKVEQLKGFSKKQLHMMLKTCGREDKASRDALCFLLCGSQPGFIPHPDPHDPKFNPETGEYEW